MTEIDPHGKDPHAPGAKLDAGKSRVWLCVSGFARALKLVANVTTQGAIKYTENGWMEVKDGRARYMDALGRHLLALGAGEKIDPDTKCHHLAQVAWNALAALELELREDEKAVGDPLNPITRLTHPQFFRDVTPNIPGLMGLVQGSSIRTPNTVEFPNPRSGPQ